MMRLLIEHRKNIMLNLFGMKAFSTIAWAFIMAIAASLPATAAERSYSIGSFDNVQIEGDLIVTVTTGKGPSASAIGSTNQLDGIKFNRNGRTLKIQLNNDSSPRRIENSRSEPLQIFISTAKLVDISINGNGIVNVNKVRSKKSRFTILGSGIINLGDAQIDNFNVLIRGGGTAKISTGNIRKSDFTINGFGSITAPQLVTQTLTIDHQGPANSIITVTDFAKISNNGTGEIEILGKGNCLIKSIGSGKILCAKSKIASN